MEGERGNHPRETSGNEGAIVKDVSSSEPSTSSPIRSLHPSLPCKKKEREKSSSERNDEKNFARVAALTEREEKAYGPIGPQTIFMEREVVGENEK